MLSRCKLVFLVVLALARVCPADDAAATFHSRATPLLAAYCTKCHGPEKQKAKVNLAGPRTPEQLAADRDVWFRALAQIESGEMPPEEAKQPTPAERAARLSAAASAPTSGRLPTS